MSDTPQSGYDVNSIVLSSISLFMAIFAGLTMALTIQILTLVMIVSTIALNIKKFINKNPKKDE